MRTTCPENRTAHHSAQPALRCPTIMRLNPRKAPGRSPRPTSSRPMPSHPTGRTSPLLLLVCVLLMAGCHRDAGQQVPSVHSIVARPEPDILARGLAGRVIARRPADDAPGQPAAGTDAWFDMPAALVHAHIAPGVALNVCLGAHPQSCVLSRVDDIYPSPRTPARTYRITAMLDTPSLPPGAVVTGHVITHAVPTIHLPLSALTTQDNRPAVWIVCLKTHEISQRKIRISARTAEGVAIDSGISPGERIVTTHIHALHAGDTVRLLDPQGEDTQVTDPEKSHH